MMAVNAQLCGGLAASLAEEKNRRLISFQSSWCWGGKVTILSKWRFPKVPKDLKVYIVWVEEPD